MLVDSPILHRLPDGRVLALDDVGDPNGFPIVYLHGTPDSRLARHPDDSLARDLGVRLLAIDRPGAGASDLHPEGTVESLGHDLAHLLDTLHLDRVALLGWSAGGLFALGAAGILGERVRAVGLVASLPPIEAYRDHAVLDALGAARRSFIEIALEMAPADLAAEVAPLLVPHPLDRVGAVEHVAEHAGERGRAELAAVPGALEQLADALMAAVTQGTGGLEHDLALQLAPGMTLSTVRAPVRAFHGTHDEISPPEVGAWLAAHLPTAVLDRVPDGSHHLHLPRWRGVLRAVCRDAGTP